MSTVKLAIVMGGGVSLGSFSGGALAGALRALHADVRRKGGELEIDVLSGASAGAMTLGLLLRNLALPGPDGGSEGDFWSVRVTEPQRRAWVKEVGLATLVQPTGDDPPGGLLSAEALEEVACTLMAWPEGTPPRRVHADEGVRLGRRVYFLATLMNLNGIPVVSERLAEQPALVDAKAATLYRDQRVYALDFDPEAEEQLGSPWPRAFPHTAGELSDPAAWDGIAQVCLAAGGFPIAFEPRVVTRTAREYGSLWPWRRGDGEGSRGHRGLGEQFWFEAPDSFPFSYGDGGAFNNEPLKEAMQLIRLVDEADDRPDTERALLFIDPNLSGTSHTEFLELHYPTSIQGGAEEPRSFLRKLLGQAGPTAGAIAGQAGFHDVRTADRTNERLEWRDGLRDLLAEMVEALPPAEAEALAQRAGRALREVLGEKAQASMRMEGYDPDRELRRVQREERERAGEEGRPEEVGDPRWPLFALVDQVAGLRGRRQVPILAVGPLWEEKPGGERRGLPLAGAFLRNFGGFLDEEFRAHDFEWGLRKGGRVRLPRREGEGEPEGPAADVPSPPPWPGEEAWERAGRALVEGARTRFQEFTRALGADVGLPRWQLLLGGVYGGVRGFRRTLNDLFSKKLAPRLRESVRKAALPRTEGCVRLRVVVLDAEAPDQAQYRLQPAEGGRGDPARHWALREQGEARFDTWVEYAIEAGPGSDPRTPPTLRFTGGPYLHLPPAGTHGPASRGALRVDQTSDGRIRHLLPLEIPLGGPNGLAAALEPRLDLLRRTGTPSFQVTLDLSVSSAPSIRWEPRFNAAQRSPCRERGNDGA